MSKPGRKHIPTQLKILRGERKSRLNKLEPQPPEPDDFDTPPYLEGLAAERWKVVYPLLKSVRVMTAADMEALARYCDLYRYWREVRKVLIDQGSTYPILNDKGEVKYIAQRPEVSIHHKLVAQLRQYEGDFGLNPSSRAGLKVSDAETQKDALDEFLTGTG